MKVLRCLIVDDEPPAIRLLEKYVTRVPFLEVISSTRSPLTALNKIEQGHIDLLFVDIQMPELTGLQLSKIIKGKVKIIFTTAYPQFALESYEIQAVDYLLKPFDFERFYEAVLKAKNSINLRESEFPQQNDEYLFVKTDGKNNFRRVFVDDICYLEGLKNYIAIHLEKEIVITHNSLKNITNELPHGEFLQIHKSFVVSLRHIQKTDSISVYVKDKALPIGNTYKQRFFDAINEKKL